MFVNKIFTPNLNNSIYEQITKNILIFYIKKIFLNNLLINYINNCVYE